MMMMEKKSIALEEEEEEEKGPSTNQVPEQNSVRQSTAKLPLV